MSVFLWDSKTSYIAVPKVACTSLKVMFFEIENKRPWERFRINGQDYHIHRLYPTLAWPDLPHARIADHARLALIRDPVKRALSCFSNRVVHHRELSVEKAGKKLVDRDLPPDPSLALFLDRVQEYSDAVPSIRHHLRPMVDFLGHDAGYFAGIYPIERMDDFLAHLSQQLGMAVEVAKLQTGGPKIDPETLTAGQVAKLKRFYDLDYAAFGSRL